MLRSPAYKALESLAEQFPEIGNSQRIELKRVRSGHVRAFVAYSTPQTAERFSEYRSAVDLQAVTLNAFYKGDRFATLQILDNLEQ